MRMTRITDLYILTSRLLTLLVKSLTTLITATKKFPERTRSVAGSQTIKVYAGNETATVFPVALLPDQIKKFPGN